MRKETANALVCPKTRKPLNLIEAVTDPAGHVISGVLVTNTGEQYPIVNGIPRTLPDIPPQIAEVAKSREYYATVGDTYDEGMDWLFKSFYSDERTTRERMIDLLEVKPGSRVLETGAGTCRDSSAIAARIGSDGKLFATDLSPEMLEVGRRRIEKLDAVELVAADATRLPFSDGYFDAAYHFGGLNLFSDRAAGLLEMARVVRWGGKVVVGDEGLAPWLRHTEYGRILVNSNRLYEHTPPLKLIPACANEVRLSWLLGNSFYLIDFRVGDPPRVDLDLPIPGPRGGTHRTRYFGALEGVTSEAKAAAQKAARRENLSLHAWLDKVIRDATSASQT
jgi:SAM-dependent methyltransferase